MGYQETDMAMFKESPYLKPSQFAAFDEERDPGSETLYAGIYRCTDCNREIVSEESQPLPASSHHTHDADHGPIRWKLMVYADHRPK
jgi:hypothetical protein